MTGPLERGSLLIDPADVPLLRFLVVEGLRNVQEQGAIPQPVRKLLRAITTAQRAATVALPQPPVAESPENPSPSELTVDEVAEVLGVSDSRVRHMITRGELPARRVGKRVLLVNADAVAAARLRRGAA